MKRYYLFLSLITIACSLHAQTFIPGGYVSGTWSYSQSPYYIQGDIEIHYDSTLLIEPGVHVLFDGAYKLTVHGLLDASGTETDSILFSTTDTVSGWQGIEFYQINEGLGVSTLDYCILTHGYKASGSGGAIYVYESENVLIDHCLIENNYAYNGGGIYMDDGWIQIMNSVITNNSAKFYAGGITCLFSVPYFYNLKITHNSGGDAGGIYFVSNPDYSYPFFEDLVISENSGGMAGGIYLNWSNTLVLDNCRINNNRGVYCGGILLFSSSLGYWGYPVQKNHIYMNQGGIAQELFYQGDDNTIINVDTFTVVNPDSYLVYPPGKFNFIDGIQYGLIEQADTDLYISESGSDTNDGLSPQSPLKTFDYALRKITGSSGDSNTLWVLPGHYYLEGNDSLKPIYPKSNVKIAATEPGEAIIDADSASRVFYAIYKNDFTLSGLTIQNGHIENQLGAQSWADISGGGVFIYSSDGNFDNCNFISNSTKYFGGGVFLEENYHVTFNDCKFIQNTSEAAGGGLLNYYPSTSAYINLVNCDFTENHSNAGGGGTASLGDQLRLVNCRYTGNTTDGSGAAASFQDEMPDLVNCQFSNNIAAENGGGCYILGGSNPKMVNCTFSDNSASMGSAIYIVYTSNQDFINTVFWNTDVPVSDMIHIKGGASCLFNYSDIQDGEDAIVLDGANSHYHFQEGVINANPAFLDPLNGDFSLNWNSPCIEAGSEDTTGLGLPLTDLNGDPRLVNARVDMGAYEYQMPVNIEAPDLQTNQFRIYPLISKTTLNLEIPDKFDGQRLTFGIFNCNGARVRSYKKISGKSRIEIDISELSAGLYLLVIMDSRNVIYTGKFIATK